jgi:hypothetical protein
MEGEGPRQAAFSGEPKATAFSGTGNREQGWNTDYVHNGMTVI